MKVLNLANVAGLNRGGGVHEVAFTYFKLQNKNEVDSHLWFPGYQSEVEELRSECKKRKNVKGLDTYFNPNYGLLKNISGYKKDLHSFDIIHQHGVWLRNSELSIYGGKNNIPIIIQPHGYLEPYSLNMSSFKKRVMYNLFEKINLSNSSLLVGCSVREVKHLKYLFPNKDIAILPNGVWHSFLTHPVTKTPDKIKNRLLFLSRIHPSKGIERLLLAFSKLKEKTINDWEIVIAGAGDINYIKSLEKKIFELNINNSVVFYGAVFGDEKIKLFDSSDLFVLPTYTENFGIVVAEALARSIPVLTTEGAPWEMLTEMNCGFWVENNQKGIDKGLSMALSLPRKELKIMGENGKRFVELNYVWENIGIKTIEMYRWIIGDINYVPDFITLGDKSLKERKIY